ncbi:MAG TPA: FAD:protein FMN transferase [Actinomycetota bacterium]|nr:FAD:protein FMN transferase [Actinomycetota bacterium]
MNGTFRAMGSTITWWGESDIGPRLAAWFERVEAGCSRFRASSELCLLNAAESETVRVSPVMERVLRAADDAYLTSEGLVDPTLLGAVEAAGYDRTFEEASKQPRRPPTPAAWSDVIVGRGCVTRPPGVRIDLGGVAKGWTAWSALDLFEGEGLVDAGGDIALRGTWKIDVTHDGMHVTDLVVNDCGVATSGVDRRRWTGGHHIIDPRTSIPAVTDVIAATVVATTTMVAETVARSIVIRGGIEGLEWADGLPDVKWAAVTTLERSTIALDKAEVVG